MRKKKLTAAERLIASARSEIEAKSKPKIDKKKYFYNLPINEQYEQIKESKKINLTKGADQDNFEDILKEQLFKEEIEARKKALEDKEESEYFADESDDTKVERAGLWDYSIDDEIKYFDPDKSYELTGYRPISKTEGLDFDPRPFQKTGRTYLETGAYTEYPKGCKPFVDFWREEIRRCVEGYTVGKYRITGDHYFFLNFYRMNVADDKVKAASGDSESFPHFAVEQYK